MNKNKFNNVDQYFSDDEDDIIEEEQLDEESDDSMDDYTRQIIREATIRNLERMENEYKNMERVQKVKKPLKTDQPDQPKKNKKQSQVLSLGEFTKKIDAEMEASKPKKFVSKRVEDKKKVMGLDNNVVKRNFNPRLPPYNFVQHNKQNQNSVNIDSKEEFPSL